MIDGVGEKVVGNLRKIVKNAVISMSKMKRTYEFYVLVLANRT